MTSSTHEEFLSKTLPTLDLVYNLARRMVRRVDDVEDLVQETYMRAFTAWTDGRRPRKVEPWIATICLNTGRSWGRRAAMRHEVLSETGTMVDAPTADDVEETALTSVRAGAVHRALWQLPEQQRIAIALMDLQGLTAAEVARATGWPRGTVLSRVHRGRKRLAEMIETRMELREET